MPMALAWVVAGSLELHGMVSSSRRCFMRITSDEPGADVAVFTEIILSKVEYSAKALQLNGSELWIMKS